MNEEFDDILSRLKELEVREPDFKNKDMVWNKITQQLGLSGRRKATVIRFVVGTISVAAMLCIVFMMGVFKVNINAPKAMCYTLPDGSEVSLNQGAALSYDRVAWYIARNVQLQGDASFKVTKGSKFTVKVQDDGEISVLGTQFFIDQEPNNLHVECSEGAVRVNTKAGSVILHKGEQVNCNAQILSKTKIPVAIPAYLDYSNMPMPLVLQALGNIYGFSIDNPEACGDIRFTGSLPTGNQAEALEVLFGTCNKSYLIKDNKVIVNAK